jgi:hypothetical protein
MPPGLTSFVSTCSQEGANEDELFQTRSKFWDRPEALHGVAARTRFPARSSSQNETRFASLALPYPLCLTMPAALSPTVMYSGTIEGETTLIPQRSYCNHSLISRRRFSSSMCLTSFGS